MTPGPWVLPDELRQLAESGEGDLVQEVLTIFQGDTSKRLETVRAALAGNDRKELKNQAHAIKGSSGQVGATAVAPICQQLESQASTGSHAQLEELVRQLESAFADVCRAMNP
jgi:HPt (histidine-containing phosphotransfer) domain-containing protein